MRKTKLGGKVLSIQKSESLKNAMGNTFHCIHRSHRRAKSRFHCRNGRPLPTRRTGDPPLRKHPAQATLLSL
jgi:hypothetical protein